MLVVGATLASLTWHIVTPHCKWQGKRMCYPKVLSQGTFTQQRPNCGYQHASRGNYFLLDNGNIRFYCMTSSNASHFMRPKAHRPRRSELRPYTTAETSWLLSLLTGFTTPRCSTLGCANFYFECFFVLVDMSLKTCIFRSSLVCRSATHSPLGEAPSRPSRQNQVYVTASFSGMTCRGRFYVVGPPVQSAHAVEDLETANFVLNDLEER